MNEYDILERKRSHDLQRHAFEVIRDNNKLRNENIRKTELINKQNLLIKERKDEKIKKDNEYHLYKHGMLKRKLLYESELRTNHKDNTIHRISKYDVDGNMLYSPKSYLTMIRSWLV
jgi:hypothetical protein